MNGNGVFCVKDIRNLLDASFLPKDTNATRWIKSIPIKINVFAWKVYLDRLPTRMNLLSRGVYVSSLLCPICNSDHEDTSHLLFSCVVASDVVRLVCRGGIWSGHLLVCTLNGCPSSILIDWVQKLKVCWKACFMLLGGAYEISEINCSLRLRNLGKM